MPPLEKKYCVQKYPKYLIGKDFWSIHEQNDLGASQYNCAGFLYFILNLHSRCLTKREMLISDNELINGLKAGQEKAIGKITERAFGPIRGMILRSGGTIEDAWEIFNIAVSTLYRKVQSEDFELSCAIGTYLYRVSFNQWMKEVSKRKNERKKVLGYSSENELESTEDFLIVEETIALDEQRRSLLYEGINSLKEDCKKIISLYLAKVKMSEITIRMNYSSDQITYNRKNKCIEYLSRAIRQNPKYKEIND